MKKKSIRQSKSLIISLFTAFLCLAAGTVRAQAGRVTIDMQQVKMTQIMDEIEKQTKFLFIYDKNISVDRTASVQVREQPVAEALAQMLAGTDLTYEINSSNIILSKRSADAAASSSLHNVAGVVLDAHGQPIIGASVVIKGTTIGISTNVDGSFGLQIPASVKDPVLVVNYLGCEPQEIAVGSRADFRITMVESAVALDNVVVTALGIKRQEKALSYNVQQVKSEDIVTVKDANFMNALNGKVAGVQINSSAAGVGGAARVVMRGAKSLYKDNNANPAGSCLPMLIQGPVFMCMFYVLSAIPYIARGKRAPLGAFDVATAQEFSSTTFFGTKVSDTFTTAGTSGKIVIGIFVFAMCACLWYMQWNTMRRNTAPASMNKQTERMQKMMLWIFPVMYIFSGVAMPFAVLVYWLANNICNLLRSFWQLHEFPTPGSPAAEDKEKRDHDNENKRRAAKGLPSIEEEKLIEAKQEAERKASQGHQRQQPQRKNRRKK